MNWIRYDQQTVILGRCGINWSLAKCYEKSCLCGWPAGRTSSKQLCAFVLTDTDLSVQSAPHHFCSVKSCSTSFIFAAWCQLRLTSSGISQCNYFTVFLTECEYIHKQRGIPFDSCHHGYWPVYSTVPQRKSEKSVTLCLSGICYLFWSASWNT